MIVPMLKYSFLVYHAEYSAFLEQLKSLGVLHIQKKELEPTPEMHELYRKYSDIVQAIKTLESQQEDKGTDVKQAGYTKGEDLLERIQEIEDLLEQKQQHNNNLEKEEKQIAPWGDFSIELIKKLQGEGINFRFLICHVKKYKSEWENDNNIAIISDNNGYRYFVRIEQGDEINQSLGFEGVDEVKAPDKPLSQLLNDIEVSKNEIVELKSELISMAKSDLPLLRTYSNQLILQLSEADVIHQTTREVEGSVYLVEGWIPEPKVDDLEKGMEQSGAYYIKSLSKPSDNPPVLLKNNRFNRLFEMIGNLYSLPNYGELDLTPFLAPFYLLFFGFCFSDAGYGLLFVIVAAWVKMKNPKSKSILSLIQLLGASTMFFGFLSGTFFGIELYKTNLPFYSNIAQAYGSVEHPIDKIVQDIMFKASLGLGLIQILFGMFLRVFKTTKQLGFKYAISTLSWAFLIIFSGVNYYLSSKGIVAFNNIPYLILAIACGIGIFFLNSPDKSLFLNFGIGLWDAYNTLIGGIGDLLSYVRLFALGLASAILGLVFNDLALKLVNPDGSIVMQGLGIIMMLFVLLVGHAINIFMSGLGSMVHPLRLTFVEFYKNAGFEGGGKPYSPFGKQ